jgi:signal transduction histidine kinase
VESDRLATIGTMAAKFGHELGNPLNGMSLTIQLLEQRLRKQLPTLDETVSSTVTRLKSEISRLNSLLQDFRSLSRKETYNFQPVQLAELVTEAIEFELPHYAELGVNVDGELPGTYRGSRRHRQDETGDLEPGKECIGRCQRRQPVVRRVNRHEGGDFGSYRHRRGDTG